MKLSGFLIIVFFSFINSNGQSNSINKPIFEFILQTKSGIPLITNTNENIIVNGSYLGQMSAKKLVKAENGFYTLIDGTGQVYKANIDKDANLSFERIDSTKFFGHSFQSINFCHNGILYSFGGYGFWHHNGQLRHFDFKMNEWVVDKINKEYNTTDFLINYLPKESKLYYIIEPKNGETTFENITDYQIIEFDLIKKENILLGELDSHIKLQKPIYINTPNLGGTLVFISGDYFLFNFKENKVLRLINSTVKNRLNGKLNDPIVNTFEFENEIYFNTKLDSAVQSVQLNLKDFIEESYPIYTARINIINYLISIFILLFLMLIYILYKQKLKKENIFKKVDELNEFNEIERSLINQIIIKASKGEYLNVEEVNTFLGIKRKSIEIQKKIRNESISRINHKFKVNYNQETSFIERIRSSNDKRVFNYTIVNENIKIYKEF